MRPIVLIDPSAEPIRSYKHRRGRLTTGRQRALDQLSSTYAVEVSAQPLDVTAVFGRRAPLVVEVGFGMGETTLAMAAADPSRDVLAVDVHTPGAGALLRAVDDAALSNVRVAVGDGLDVLQHMLSSASCDEIRVYFPDPWPKARHRKRRLVDAAFTQLAADRLVPGGRLHCATDWQPYAEQMLAAVEGEPLLVSEVEAGYVPRPPWRPVTRYEWQGLAKGHRVFDVIARRAARAPAP